MDKIKNKRGKYKQTKKNKMVPRPGEVWSFANTILNVAREYDQGFLAASPYLEPDQRNLQLKHKEILPLILKVKGNIDKFWSKRNYKNEKWFQLECRKVLYKIYSDLVDNKISLLEMGNAIDEEFDYLSPAHRELLKPKDKSSFVGRGGASRYATKMTSKVYGYSTRTLDADQAKTKGYQPFCLYPRSEILKFTLTKVFFLSDVNANRVINFIEQIENEK